MFEIDIFGAGLVRKLKWGDHGPLVFPVATPLMMLKLKNKMKSSDVEFADEILKFNKSFEKLKSGLAITKNINSLFHNSFFIIEKQCWAIVQYSRRRIRRDYGYSHFSPG